MTEPRRVAVIGAGTMGHGIAYVAALSGYRVRLTDADPAQIVRGMDAIAAAFEKAIGRGKVTAEQRDAAIANLTAVTSVPDAVRDAVLVIEAIPERIELKQALFGQIEPLVSDGTLLASNTSSLSIDEIGEGLQHCERVIGLHFFNPVPVMQLLEIVRGPQTSSAAVLFASLFAARIGKSPIVVRDTPGFATSRLGVVLGLEAIRMLEQGVASAEDIDRAMELGYNHPLGPLRLTDLVGLDVRLAIADHLHATLGGATYAAPELLRQKVREGKLGKKSGEGFYRWENG